MAVGFGGVVAEAAQHVDADFLGRADSAGAASKSSSSRGIMSMPRHCTWRYQVWWLMPADDDIDLAAVELLILADQPFALGPMFDAALVICQCAPCTP